MRHDLNKVLDIGMELLQTSGYHATGTEDILSSSGLPRSSFYHHYGSKEGFAIKVVEKYGQEGAQFYRSILKDPDLNSQKERLMELLYSLIEVSSEESFKTQCLIQKLTNEVAVEHIELKKALLLQMSGMLDEIDSCIQIGQETGEFTRTQSSRALARFIHGQIYGSFTLGRIHDSETVMKSGVDSALNFISNT